jgi:hypothetical protein
LIDPAAEEPSRLSGMLPVRIFGMGVIQTDGRFTVIVYPPQPHFAKGKSALLAKLVVANPA